MSQIDLKARVRELTEQEQATWDAYKRIWEDAGVMAARNLWINTSQELRKAKTLLEAQQENLCESQPLPPGTLPGATSM